LSVVSVKGVHPMSGFKGGGNNSGSANKYTKFGQLIVRKILKILPPDVTLSG